MAGGSPGPDVLNSLNTLAQVGVVGDLTDGQLVQRFVTTRGPAAQAVFTALVDRHGPMVLRVCRQVLGDADAAQDAFQATFLVLARKAGSVRRADSVASWLHGVALRIARRARTEAARRRRHERRGGAMKTAEPERAEDRPESWPELHEEIARLPERYREPVVLCYLEGLSTEAAALRIGCPRGTILSRLARARDRLRGRLTRRGVALPAVALAWGLTPEAATAMAAATAPALPAALLEATVRASLGFAGRQAVEAGAASTAATTLARGVLHAMTISKLKVLATAALASILGLGGLQTLAFHAGGPEEPAAQPAPPGTEDRQAGLVQRLATLQARFDESVRSQAELRKEVQTLRDELKALRAAGQPAAGRGPRGVSGTAPSGLPAARGGGGMAAAFRGAAGQFRPPGAGGDSSETRHAQFGKLVVGVSPRGNKVYAYDTEAKRTHLLDVSTSTEDPFQFVPMYGPHSVALYLRGRTITRTAVLFGEKWYPQDLREPVPGSALPVVTVLDFSGGGGSTADVLIDGYGRYVYGFSPTAGRWDVLKLPEGASWTPQRAARGGPSRNPTTVDVGGHIYTFDPKTGTWDDLDLDAIVKSAGDPKADGASPKK